MQRVRRTRCLQVSHLWNHWTLYSLKATRVLGVIHSRWRKASSNASFRQRRWNLVTQMICMSSTSTIGSHVAGLRLRSQAHRLAPSNSMLGRCLGISWELRLCFPFCSTYIHEEVRTKTHYAPWNGMHMFHCQNSSVKIMT
jgi:hypothetical protein